MVSIFEIEFLSNGQTVLTQLTNSAQRFEQQAIRTQGAAGVLSSGLTGLTNRVIGLAAAYVGLHTIKDAYDLFQRQTTAIQQLTVTYQDNEKYTKENLENLKEYAIAQEGVTGVFREQIDAMETSLLAHHDIRISFEKIIPAVIDYSAATGTSALVATQQFSRVLGNPLLAMRLLRQAHIDITKTQQKWMSDLYNSGHYVEYQSFLIKQLGERYHGAAAAILAANPGLQLELQFRQAQAELGKLSSQILVDALPALKSFLLEVQHGIQWLEANKESVEKWGKALGELVLIFMGINTVVRLTSGAMIILNGVMDANPIWLAVTAVAALVVEYRLLTGAINDASKAKNAGDIDPMTGLNYGQETSNLIQKFQGMSPTERKSEIDFQKGLIENEEEKKKKDLTYKPLSVDYALGTNQPNAMQANKLGSWFGGNAYNDLIAQNDLLAKNNYLLSQYTALADSPQITGTNTGTNTGDGNAGATPTAEDLKGGNRVTNTWNIKNFGINEPKFNYATFEANKQKLYDAVMEVLTAAQRDSQVATGHS